MDPTISGAIALSLEKCINKALQYDPGTRHKLVRIQEQILQCECRSPELSLYFLAKTEQAAGEIKIQVTTFSEQQPEAKINGAAVDILLLLLSSKHSLANSKVSILGNSSLLAEYQAALSSLDIDWEQAVLELTGSPMVGSIPGHQAANALKKITTWMQKTGSKAANNIADYLSEELRAIPANAELENFFQDVTTVRQNTDRLEARIDTLINKQKKS